MSGVRDDTMINTGTRHYWTTEEVYPTQTEVEQRQVQKKLA